MAGKKSKGGGNGKKKSSKTAKRSGGAKRTEGVTRSKSRCQMDIFNEVAMENAYYLCHNIQDVLKTRGFPWPDAQKKKKKGKRK